jgi:hypothetical protein
MTKKEFIALALVVHGNRYDYSELPDELSKDQNIIVRYSGEDYVQRVRRHLMGKRPELSYKRKTTDDFIREARDKWGEEYDYGLVEYNGAHRPVKIIYEGVLYEQTPACHLRHRPEKRMTRVAFIERAREKWGDDYDYSLVRFMNMDTKVVIVEKDTGESYEQTPTCHLRGRPKKRKPKKKKKTRKLSFATEDFIRLSKMKWGMYTYDYSRTVYSNKKSSMLIGMNGELGEHYLKSHFDNIFKRKTDNGVVGTDPQKIVDTLYGGKYDYIGYDRKKGHHTLKCPYHGVITVTDRGFKRGTGCERCTKNHDRQRIVRMLKRHSIPFEKDRIVSDGERWYRFDFYLPDSGTFIDMCGIEHYQPVEYHGGITMYELIKEDDMMKRLFCEENYYDYVILRYDKKFSLDELIGLDR